ncbi:MAG: hemerythrin domain-containing protein [Betaproteobacteria bacterium]|jgi:hemerythrin-like domain-containing protein|nr:hemerythrin domain-containing protein [Betaproteobacteria bacterium]
MNQPSKPSDPASDNAVGQFSHAHVGILMQLDRLSTLPALLAPARMAQDTAKRVVDFFREAVFEHHKDEEEALFPALLESAHAGEERQRVNTLVDALTAEHREIEGLWRQLEPELKHVAQGRSYHINAPVLEDLVSRYQAHAQVEETQLLPLADTILGRHGNHMAALGLSLHMRHQPPPIGHI